MSNAPDTYEIARMYKYLRVCDVADALDAVGRADITLVDPAIRPLFPGIKFWGVAVTLRAIPANKRMYPVLRDQALTGNVCRLWNAEPEVGDVLGSMPPIREHVRQGTVVVTDAHGCMESGIWGSSNSLGMMALGAVVIVSDGCIRDTGELTMTRTPVVCRQRGRTIWPGRTMFGGYQEPIQCGGVLLRPGDIVGCDDDGLLVVPAEIAEEVGKIASDILIDDEKGRRRHYERLGLPLDESVDVETLEELYRPWR